jgi:hypothetical protein
VFVHPTYMMLLMPSLNSGSMSSSEEVVAWLEGNETENRELVKSYMDVSIGNEHAK